MLKSIKKNILYRTYFLWTKEIKGKLKKKNHRKITVKREYFKYIKQNQTYSFNMGFKINIKNHSCHSVEPHMQYTKTEFSIKECPNLSPTNKGMMDRDFSINLTFWIPNDNKTVIKWINITIVYWPVDLNIQEIFVWYLFHCIL